MTKPMSSKVIFIDAKAEPGGNGSQAKPFRSLGEAGVLSGEFQLNQTYHVAPGDYLAYIKEARRRGRKAKEQA